MYYLRLCSRYYLPTTAAYILRRALYCQEHRSHMREGAASTTERSIVSQTDPLSHHCTRSVIVPHYCTPLEACKEIAGRWRHVRRLPVTRGKAVVFPKHTGLHTTCNCPPPPPPPKKKKRVTNEALETWQEAMTIHSIPNAVKSIIYNLFILTIMCNMRPGYPFLKTESRL